MSAYSTININREQAEAIVKEKLENLHRLTDEELGNFIDVLWDRQLLNCLIVPKGMED